MYVRGKVLLASVSGTPALPNKTLWFFAVPGCICFHDSAVHLAGLLLLVPLSPATIERALATRTNSASSHSPRPLRFPSKSRSRPMTNCSRFPDSVLTGADPESHLERHNVSLASNTQNERPVPLHAPRGSPSSCPHTSSFS